jgi:hypothetical protein
VLITEEMQGIMHRHGPMPVMEVLVPLLAERKPEYDRDTELREAGDFVYAFGCLFDLFDVDGEPSLEDMQHYDTDDDSAWGLLGHWSIERGDGSDVRAGLGGFAGDQPAEFAKHLTECGTCAYLEGVLAILTVRENEDCPDCGGGADDHIVGPDADGQAQAWCKENWTRVQPLVGNGGDCGGDRQVSEAFDARWTEKLVDKTFALITRSWYVAEDNEGHMYIECQTEYLNCRDLRAPGDTEIYCDYLYERLDDEDLDGEEPTEAAARKLAEEAEDPEPGEWARHLPNAPDFAIKGAAK